jgi:hypothetical protein
LAFLIEMMFRASPRGVHTSTTIRPRRKPRRDESGLSVVAAVVGPRERAPGENHPGIREIEAALGQRPIALDGIEGDAY